MRIISVLAHRLRKARLDMAEQDLQWMESHAPASLEQQRASVRALRNRIAADIRTSDQVRRDVERGAKARVMQ